MQQDVFNLADLETISFECPSCLSEVVLRADRPRNKEKGEKIACALCRHEMAFADRIFDRYVAIFEDAQSLNGTVKLRAAPRPMYTENRRADSMPPGRP